MLSQITFDNNYNSLANTQSAYRAAVAVLENEQIDVTEEKEKLQYLSRLTKIEFLAAAIALFGLGFVDRLDIKISCVVVGVSICYVTFQEFAPVLASIRTTLEPKVLVREIGQDCS